MKTFTNIDPNASELLTKAEVRDGIAYVDRVTEDMAKHAANEQPVFDLMSKGLAGFFLTPFGHYRIDRLGSSESEDQQEFELTVRLEDYPNYGQEFEKALYRSCGSNDLKETTYHMIALIELRGSGKLISLLKLDWMGTARLLSNAGESEFDIGDVPHLSEYEINNIQRFSRILLVPDIGSSNQGCWDLANIVDGELHPVFCSRDGQLISFRSLEDAVFECFDVLKCDSVDVDVSGMDYLDTAFDPPMKNGSPVFLR